MPRISNNEDEPDYPVSLIILWYGCYYIYRIVRREKHATRPGRRGIAEKRAKHENKTEPDSVFPFSSWMLFLRICSTYVILGRVLRFFLRFVAPGQATIRTGKSCFKMERKLSILYLCYVNKCRVHGVLGKFVRTWIFNEFRDISAYFWHRDTFRNLFDWVYFTTK